MAELVNFDGWTSPPEKSDAQTLLRRLNSHHYEALMT